MMIRALYDYAQSRKLVEDPDFEMKKVPFVAVIDAEGRLVEFIDQSETQSEILIPRVPSRPNIVRPSFLVDNAKYVFGVDSSEDPQPETRLRALTEAFDALVAEAADCQSPADADLSALREFCLKKAENIKLAKKMIEMAQWGGAGLIAFRLVGSDNSYVHESRAAKAFWKARCAEGKSELRVGRCIVSGQVAPIGRLHPGAKRVPGGQAMGCMMTSFNAAAFESHDWKQGLNAQVSEEVVNGYVTALNHLLSKPKAGDRSYESGVRLGDDSVILFWTAHSDDAERSLLDIFDPARDKKSAEAVFESPLKGLKPGPRDAESFFAVTLGGNASRIVIRDWFTSTLREVKANVLQYFENLELVGNPRPGRPQSMWQLIAAIDPPGRSAAVPPDLSTRLMRAALRGGPMPPVLLRNALVRLRHATDDRFKSFDLTCLIKAVLISNYERTVDVALDIQNTDSAYLCGRLFAALEKLQQEAIGEVNASIRDRFFAAASTTPSVVFPRLLRLSVHHEGKADRSKYFEKLKGEIVNVLPAKGFPKSLDLEEQGLFAVGYYHQRQHFFTKAVSSLESTSKENNQ